MKTIILKNGRSAPFKNRHPWLFSGAIARVEGNPEPGDIVRVIDEESNFLAWGLFNPHSQIRTRLYSFTQSEKLNAEFFRYRIMRAFELRERILGFKPNPDNAYRLINSEGDGLSGLTVDRYGSYLSVQFTSLALFSFKDIILEVLNELAQPAGIFLRTEADILAEENLELKDGLIFGTEPTQPLIINENGVRFEVNLATGQKTGFYLDQRANRILLEQYAQGRKLLDLCTYSGGFALHALKAGARHVSAVDVSANALELAQRNARLNDFSLINFTRSDMFKYLDKCSAEGEKFDLIVLDPPKMSHAKSSVQSALKGYLQLNSTAMQCLYPGGILFTCSCSGRISREFFLLTLHRAALAVGKNLKILDVRGSGPDHPVMSSCPESEYLKCVICSVE